MYRAFELESPISLPRAYLDKGQALKSASLAAVRRKLDSFALGQGTLDGSKIQEVWFPNVPADVFISHSHHDVDDALTLAGWLHETFGLQPFVDSSIWGYANDLVKRIDDDFCKIDEGRYYYDKCNASTSHVHMMLAAALQMMIDSTECAIFLNTRRSITSEEAVKRTKSPWIYAELGFLELVRRRKKEAHRGSIKEASTQFSAKAARQLDVSYIARRTSLTPIDSATLAGWKAAYLVPHRPRAGADSLDWLYQLAPDKTEVGSDGEMIHG